MTLSEPVVTSAREYTERISGINVLLPSGAVFRVRVLTMQEYLEITRDLLTEFKNRIKPDSIMTIGTDFSNPDILLAYSKKSLPRCILEPKIVATVEEVTVDSVCVESIPPMDLIRLNMLSLTASTGVRSLLASFLPGESSVEELERLRGLAEKVAE